MILHFTYESPFLAPEATLPLSSTKNCDLWKGPISEHAQNNRFVFSAYWKFVRLNFEHAMSHGRPVNCEVKSELLLHFL